MSGGHPLASNVNLSGKIRLLKFVLEYLLQQNMLNKIGKDSFYRAAAILIGGVILISAFLCLYASLANMHTAGEEAGSCLTLMSLGDSAIVQAGTVIVLMIISLWFGLKFNTLSVRSILRLIRRCPSSLSPPDTTAFREYAYLNKLFRTGRLHPKLHNRLV